MGVADLVLFGSNLCLLLMVRVSRDEKVLVKKDGADGVQRYRRNSGGCTESAMEQIVMASERGGGRRRQKIFVV